MRALFRAREQSPGFRWELAESVCVLMKNMVPLPVGTVLWHAAPPPLASKTTVLDPTDVLPTSTVREDAEAYANKNFTSGEWRLFRLHISDPAPYGVAIAGDSFYEQEKEVLLAPGFEIEYLKNKIEGVICVSVSNVTE